jgi:hypothetical protein
LLSGRYRVPLYPVIQAVSSVARLICDADVYSTLGVVVVCSGSGSVWWYQAGGLEQEAECHVTGGGKRGTW